MWKVSRKTAIAARVAATEVPTRRLVRGDKYREIPSDAVMVDKYSLYAMHRHKIQSGVDFLRSIHLRVLISRKVTYSGYVKNRLGKIYYLQLYLIS